MPKLAAANPQELQEILNDSGRMRAMFQAGASGDTEPFNEFMETYRNNMLKNDPDVLAQNKEQFELFATTYLRENGVAPERLNLNPNASSRIGKRALYNNKAMGAKHDGSFADLAELTHAISNFSLKNESMHRKLEGLRNDASSLKPSDGGFLIPERMRAEVLRIALENSLVRSRARVIPMDALKVPIPSVDSTSNVSSVFGGIVGYWTEEGATLTESKPRFGRITLEAHKLTLYIEVPNELLNDSMPSYGAFIDEMFPEAIGWFEDVAFFIGGGVGEPLGFLNAPAAVSVTRSTTVAGSNVEWVDITAMYARMLPQSLSRAVWVVSPDVVPDLLNMTVGTNGNAVWLGGGGFPSATAAPTMQMLGLPLIVSEKAAAIGTAGDINLVDFGHYLLGDRQAMTARQSEDFRFNEDVTAFRVIERLDGRPWLQSAITPRNGGATLSPFVKLTTAA